MLGLLSILAAAVPPLNADPVIFSFAFFGCNRVDKSDWDTISNPSSANLPQLRRTFRDILDIKPRPKILFAVGDLVLGYADDQGETARKQLDAWITEYRTSPLRGKIALVPISGNHELNSKVGDERKENKFTTAMWNDWITTNHLMPVRPNGPKKVSQDGLVDDQSWLNFSFDSGNFHFTCLNTDTRVSSGMIGCVPAKWAKDDIDRAKRAGKQIFVLGHRNVVDPTSVKGDAPIEPASGSALLDAMSGNKSVIAYLCAHVHAWDVSKIRQSATWQIIAGNGGSSLEKGWNPPGGPTYGFGVIEANRSGKIVLVPYYRPAINRDDPEPAKAGSPIVLSAGAR